MDAQAEQYSLLAVSLATHRVPYENSDRTTRMPCWSMFSLDAHAILSQLSFTTLPRT